MKKYMKASVQKNKKEFRKDVRMDEFTWNRINWLAKRYAGGNITKWMIHGALNADRVFLVKKKKKKRP